jgi:hypothetical protein
VSVQKERKRPLPAATQPSIAILHHDFTGFVHFHTAVTAMIFFILHSAAAERKKLIRYLGL